MDIALEFLDEHILDGVYAHLLPSTTVVTNASSVNAPTSVLSRDDDIRICLSIFLVLTVGAWFFYLFAGLFSYYVFFDHELMKHPKFLKNQIRQEIKSSITSLPAMGMLTVPWFWGEVRGYSNLYDNYSLYGGWLYMIISIGLFLFATDFAIYWIHRYLHHPYLYKWFHKLHHKWIIPTPFASHAFHPVDGYLQSIPYHIFVYLVPMHKYLYMMMFIFVNFWTVAIHDGNFMLRSTVINSSAHHSVHHLYFNYNYGQYFTLWDRIGGSHRQPTEEQYNIIVRNNKEVWAKQAQNVERIQKKSSTSKKH